MIPKLCHWLLIYLFYEVKIRNQIYTRLKLCFVKDCQNEKFQNKAITNMDLEIGGYIIVLL